MGDMGRYASGAGSRSCREGVERVVAAEAVGMEEEVVVGVVEVEVEVEVGWSRRRRW